MRPGCERVLDGLTLSEELGVGDHLDPVGEIGRSNLRTRHSRSAVPAGTVDFSTTTTGPDSDGAMLRVARSSATRLASPEARAGVPTQMKIDLCTL